MSETHEERVREYLGEVVVSDEERDDLIAQAKYLDKLPGKLKGWMMQMLREWCEEEVACREVDAHNAMLADQVRQINELTEDGHDE